MIEAMASPSFRFLEQALAAGTAGDSALNLMAEYEHLPDEASKLEYVLVLVQALVAERALRVRLRKRPAGLAPLPSGSLSSGGA